MNEQNDNIEDLEKELLELKKKKLQKQISDLEKDLDIPEATTEVDEHPDPVISNRTTKKRGNGNLVFIFILVIAVVLVFTFNQDGFDFFSSDILPPSEPEFIGARYLRNASREYTFNNRTGCIPILRFNLDNHPVLGQPGKTTFEVQIPNFETTFKHSITNTYKASVVMVTSTNFVNGDNLYTDQNFVQTDLTNNIIISKEGSRKTYKFNPKVPEVILGLEKAYSEVCDYRVNK